MADCTHTGSCDCGLDFMLSKGRQVRVISRRAGKTQAMMEQARAEGYRAGIEAAARVCAERRNSMIVRRAEEAATGGGASYPSYLDGKIGEAANCERAIRALDSKQGGG